MILSQVGDAPPQPSRFLKAVRPLPCKSSMLALHSPRDKLQCLAADSYNQPLTKLALNVIMP